MLQVAETTIKRWADQRIIPCVKTPGGHRKFLLKEIVRFAETNGYTIAGSQPPPLTPVLTEQLAIGIHTGNFARIADVFREEALSADREGMFTLLLYLYKQHVPFAMIIDEIVRPAFDSIGQKWETGEVEVTQEHAASQIAMESLILMSSELHHKNSNGLSALCACPEGELHETGLRGLAYSLECEGWRVHFMGANTPVENLASFVRVFCPELICLSVTTARYRGHLLNGLRKLATLVHSYHGRIIIGGSYATKLDQRDVKCDHIAGSIRDAIEYSRDAFHLKPGAKRNAEPKEKLHRKSKPQHHQSKTN